MRPSSSQSKTPWGEPPLARQFARQVLQLDIKNGAAVGVLGPWGIGKTSFLNLARVEFEHQEALILEFNPWMFSGAEQLVERFFLEIAAQLRVRKSLADVGEVLAAGGS